ncbi:MAG: anti-sigma factor family protein [Saprospiraceae bacterium]
MENIDSTQIESYLRGKMSGEERSRFESALASDPALRRQTEELRQLAESVRAVGRADIRKRVETLRDQIKKEESGQEAPPKAPPKGWITSAALLSVGILLGLGLGWLLFCKECPPLPPTPIPEVVTNKPGPVAKTPFDELYRAQISGPQPGDSTSLTVLYLPGLDMPNQPSRKYALDAGGTGLCIYARRGDDFWKQALELSQSGKQFFLKIGNEKFLLVDDGEERPFPEKPSGN